MFISQIVTQSRNGIHKIMVENYSGTRTPRCEHCLRSWMPSELPSSTIPNMPRKSVERALSARGIFLLQENNGTLRQLSNSSTNDTLPMKVPHGVFDSDSDLRMRNRLHECVWWENISLRRPWSWLSHSKYTTACGMQKCGHDCPINVSVTFVVLIVWVGYVVNVVTSV